MRRVLLFLSALTVAAACASVPEDARLGVSAPDRGQFDPVAKLLDHRCGSLDCHGTTFRNLRIYGCEGLRLADTDEPRCRASGGTDTTKAEIDATYRSVVGLEPAPMSSVVQGKGAHPEILTLVRKARNTENHKGGQIFEPGDSQDVCLTSWLAGKTDTDACGKAVTDNP